MATCFCLCVSSVWGVTNPETEKGVDNRQATSVVEISKAFYPEMAQYPNERSFLNEATREFDEDGFEKVYEKWRQDREKQLDQPEGYADHLNEFFATTIQQFLSGAEGENRVYSPVNVYMALSMLAEITDGESQAQILSLLGAKDIKALQAQASSVWNANYCKDGAVTSVLANSLWLNQNIKFNQSTMDTLSKHYYTSSYQGKMGSDELNQALHSWLNEQTGGLLEKQVDTIEMDSETILAFASTIYFQAKWCDEFSKSSTTKDVFHGLNKDVTCEFMHQRDSKRYYWGEKFAATTHELKGSGKMWLILPDEGVSVEELLSDKETMDLFLSNEEWKNSKDLTVNLAMPKFDVTSDIDLASGLRNLGITNIFDCARADFSPMTTSKENIYMSEAKHTARVMVDEEGCLATAYTPMFITGAMMPPEEEVDFILNRPFMFVITGESGLPLFVGTVNKPI